MAEIRGIDEAGVPRVKEVFEVINRRGRNPTNNLGKKPAGKPSGNPEENPPPEEQTIAYGPTGLVKKNEQEGKAIDKKA